MCFHCSKEGPDCAVANPVNECLDLVARMLKESKSFVFSMKPIHLSRWEAAVL